MEKTIEVINRMLEERVFLKNGTKVPSIPHEPENLIEYGKLLSEQIKSGGCLEINDIQIAFNSILAVYQNQGFKPAK